MDEPLEDPRMRATMLEAIAAAPSDDAPRLVYADWLLERNDPRGELIQIQIAMARAATADLEPLRLRERELLAAHQEDWLGTPYDPNIRWLFDRGFPTGRFGHAGLFVERARELERQPAFACHRYFPDGTAISVSIGAGPTPEVLSQVAKWFVHGYDDGGTYQIELAPGAPPEIRYSSTSSAGTVEYVGRISGATIVHTWHSQINGADGKTALEIALVEGCDSRGEG